MEVLGGYEGKTNPFYEIFILSIIKASIISESQGTELELAGDGKYDSQGNQNFKKNDRYFCFKGKRARYCTYFTMILENMKIVGFSIWHKFDVIIKYHQAQLFSD